MIRLQNVTFSYKRTAPNVLSDFSLEIPQGGIYGLLGKNGAGKSTLLYLIAGLLTPASGTITYDGIITRQRKPETLREIFIVPEEFFLPPVSLKEYVHLNAPFYPKFNLEDLYRNLEIFGLTDNLHLGNLSMGQKKKVFLSFALACNTSLLLLDEPTNGLDIPGKSQFRKFIVTEMNDERTIIISTHQVNDIDRILDHIIITDNRDVLLNSSVVNIISKLKFVDTDSEYLISRALYCQPSIGGSNIILQNKDNSETPLNIETLFEFALKEPSEIKKIFNSKSDEQ